MRWLRETAPLTRLRLILRFLMCHTRPAAPSHDPVGHSLGPSAGRLDLGMPRRTVGRGARRWGRRRWARVSRTHLEAGAAPRAHRLAALAQRLNDLGPLAQIVEGERGTCPSDQQRIRARLAEAHDLNVRYIPERPLRLLDTLGRVGRRACHQLVQGEEHQERMDAPAEAASRQRGHTLLEHLDPAFFSEGGKSSADRIDAPRTGARMRFERAPALDNWILTLLPAGSMLFSVAPVLSMPPVSV